MIIFVTRKLPGIIIATIKVSNGLMVSMNHNVPTTNTTLEISCVKLCCKVVAILSMSLTAIYIRLPFAFLSKKEIGTLFIFDFNSFRKT